MQDSIETDNGQTIRQKDRTKRLQNCDLLWNRILSEKLSGKNDVRLSVFQHIYEFQEDT